MISYKKLFDLLDKKKIKKVDLRTKYGINPKTVDSLVKNKSVTVDTLCQLCELLDCQPGDIAEYIPDSFTASDKPADAGLKDEMLFEYPSAIEAIYGKAVESKIIDEETDKKVNDEQYYSRVSIYVKALLKHGIIERCTDGYRLITDTEADK